MRKVQRKLLCIFIVCCILLGFTVHNGRIHRTQCPPYNEYKQNEKGSYLAKWLSVAGLLFDSEKDSSTQSHQKAIIKYTCHQYNLINSTGKIAPFVARQLFVEHSHKFIYCEVPKVGCSNWKRIILLLNKTLGATADDLKHEDVHTTPLLTRLSSYSPEEQRQLLNNYTKVMFTRNPLNRLVSAYRDKFLHHEPYYSKTVADIIKSRVRKNKNSSENVTFQEFVHFLIQENPNYRDTHWKPMFQLCDPCNIQYDIVGKFETIDYDAEYVLRAIGAPEHLKYPSIKHYPNESRTHDMISVDYLRLLPNSVFQCLTYVYKLDFLMFEYSPIDL